MPKHWKQEGDSCMMGGMKKNEMSELRALLEAERDSLEEDLASHGRAIPETGDWQGNSSGLQGEEADPADAADQIEELITNVPLVEELEGRYKDVRRAIQKMEDGKYGICEVCNEEIPMDRLEANPAARSCIKHSK